MKIFPKKSMAALTLVIGMAFIAPQNSFAFDGNTITKDNTQVDLSVSSGKGYTRDKWARFGNRSIHYSYLYNAAGRRIMTRIWVYQDGELVSYEERPY